MKIVFLCGSLQPGKDGVGDYVLRLAKELILQGHQVHAVALFDKFINEDINGVQIIEGVSVPILRMSSSFGIGSDFKKIKEYIEKINPDWLSLQFVPFSFQNKGLPFKLGKQISSLTGSFKWHIMFHEPWVELNRHSTIKHRVLSLAQQIIIKRLVKKVRPVIVNTSNPHYQEILNKEGVLSSVLALPSNISISNSALDNFTKEFSTLGITTESRHSWRILGIFGKIRSNVDFIPLLTKMKKEAELEDKRLAFFSIGKSGSLAKKNLLKIALDLDPILVHEFGERTTEEISAYLQLLDYGVSSVPNPFLGKSGAVSAMRLHGLKVLVPDSISGIKNYSANKDDDGQFDSNSYSSRSVSIDFINKLESCSKIQETK